MHELDSRKKAILQALVLEYVDGAEPVASELLVHKYSLGVKSATVRNELADLTELGLVEQPHTSAGRIPSDMGYRYYVDRIYIGRDPDADSAKKLKSNSKEGDALLGVLRDTARTLSKLTHLMSVATTSRNSGVQVRTALVSALGPAQALLVVVLSNGHVENRVLECPVGLTLQDIGALNERLGAQLAGISLSALARLKSASPSADPADKLYQQVVTWLKAVAKELTRGTVIAEGEEYILAQPEFQRDVRGMTDMLESLLDSPGIHEALHGTSTGTVQSVSIGREHREAALQQFSVVRNSYFVAGHEAGVIALIGPTRMSYDTSIPLVDFTAKALSESLTRFFG